MIFEPPFIHDMNSTDKALIRMTEDSGGPP